MNQRACSSPFCFFEAGEGEKGERGWPPDAQGQLAGLFWSDLGHVVRGKHVSITDVSLSACNLAEYAPLFGLHKQVIILILT